MKVYLERDESWQPEVAALFTEAPAHDPKNERPFREYEFGVPITPEEYKKLRRLEAGHTSYRRFVEELFDRQEALEKERRKHDS